MKKKIILTSFSWSMVLFIMLIIYFFSEENGIKSEETSGEVIKDVLEVVLPKEEITEEVVLSYQFPFRKTAHFCVFMLLGLCFANAFNATFKFRSIYKYVYSLISSILYAIFDEIHQGFVEYRTPLVTDVVVDSIGSLFGIIFFAFIFYVLKKHKPKRKSKNVTADYSETV